MHTFWKIIFFLPLLSLLKMKLTLLWPFNLCTRIFIFFPPSPFFSFPTLGKGGNVKYRPCLTKRMTMMIDDHVPLVRYLKTSASLGSLRGSGFSSGSGSLSSLSSDSVWPRRLPPQTKNNHVDSRADRTVMWNNTPYFFVTLFRYCLVLIIILFVMVLEYVRWDQDLKLW